MPRPSKPLGLHVLHGTLVGRKKRREKRENELQLKPEELGAAPAYFDEAMKAEWNRVTQHPELRQILCTVHRPLIEHHCVLYARFIQDAKGERTLTASERQTFHSIQMQLGWTPASQSKVKTPAKPQAKSPWAALRD